MKVCLVMKRLMMVIRVTVVLNVLVATVVVVTDGNEGPHAH